MAKAPRRSAAGNPAPTEKSSKATNEVATGQVGPGNPPLHSRFKPGQSGNPAGRPPKERSLVRLIEKELDVEVTVTENGAPQRLSKREALAKRTVNSALTGDAKALQTLVRLIGTGSSNDAADQEQIDPQILASLLQRLIANQGEGS